MEYPDEFPSSGSFIEFHFAYPSRLFEFALFAKLNKKADALALLKLPLLDTFVFTKETDEFLLNS